MKRALPGGRALKFEAGVIARSRHVLPAIGGQRRAGDEAGLVGGEEDDAARHLLRLAETAALSAGMLLAMSSPPASATGRVYASVTFPGENRRREVSIIQE